MCAYLHLCGVCAWCTRLCLHVGGHLLWAEEMELPRRGRDQRVESDPREGEGTKERLEKQQSLENKVAMKEPLPCRHEAGVEEGRFCSESASGLERKSPRPDSCLCGPVSGGQPCSTGAAVQVELVVKVHGGGDDGPPDLPKRLRLGPGSYWEAV